LECSFGWEGLTWFYFIMKLFGLKTVKWFYNSNLILGEAQNWTLKIYWSVGHLYFLYSKIILCCLFTTFCTSWPLRSYCCNELIGSVVVVVRGAFFHEKKKFLQKLYKNAFKFPKKNALKIFIYNRNEYIILSSARNIYF